MVPIKEKAFFSILIPTYNGAKLVGDTLQSILNQSYTNFEIIINDNNSQDKTIEFIKHIHSPKIKIYKNKQNLGYPKNLSACLKHATGHVIFLMGQDDILAQGTLKDIHHLFMAHPELGAVTRPYYWFDETVTKPVRAKKELNHHQTQIIKITDSPDLVIRVFDTLDQLSGLALKRELIDLPFHPDIFTSHIYPFASIFKNHPVAFLNKYRIAVRIFSSISRTVSSTYDKSPLLSWINLVNTVYHENKYTTLRHYLIDRFITKNYVGLVQIKNFSTLKNLIKEIYYLVIYRPQNLLSLTFWFFTFGTIITPPQLLIPLVDWYKRKIYHQTLLHIDTHKFLY